MSVFRRMLNGSSGCQDLLACVFHLNRLETQAYFSLLERPGARMEQIANALDRDRSTAHRAVQRLRDLGLAERETRPLDGGGYCYVYRAVDPAIVRERIEERLDAFETAVREKMDTFQEEAQQHATPPAPTAEDQSAQAST